jgi:hypothetical protein
MPPEFEAMMEEAGIPRRKNIQRVIPVMQTKEVGDISVSILSLDLYDDSFLARFEMRLPQQPRSRNPFLMFAVPQIPQIYFDVSDDTGRVYEPSPSGFFGDGGGDEEKRRFEILYSPSPADANVLIVVAQQVMWTSYTLGVRPVIQPGPWRFEISLT